jgi:hypothetical protein
MTPTPRSPLELPDRAFDELVRLRRPQLMQATASIATAARALLAFVPAEVNPVVVTRDRIEQLQQAAEVLVALMPEPAPGATAHRAQARRELELAVEPVELALRLADVADVLARGRSQITEPVADALADALNGVDGLELGDWEGLRRVALEQRGRDLGIVR